MMQDTSRPLVSVIIPAYNAEAHITETISSVLHQSYTQLQLIVVDDCSTDRTAQLVSEVSDPRVELVHLERNGHVCAARNAGLARAKGDYIAFLDADDLWKPEKLKLQVDELEAHPEVGCCFTWGEIIDDAGRPQIPGDGSSEDLQWLYAAFHAENRPHRDWFLHFLDRGNSLLCSSSLIRRSIVDRVGQQNVALRQLQDYDYWIRCLCLAPLHILQEELTGYRRVEGGSSLSAESEANRTRTVNEEIYLVTHMFDTMDDRLFVELFSDLFRNPKAVFPEELACEKAFLLRRSYVGPDPYLSHMQQLITCPETRTLLERVYHYRQQDFYKENTTPRYYNQAMADDLAETKRLLNAVYASRRWRMVNFLPNLIKKLLGRT